MRDFITVRTDLLNEVRAGRSPTVSAKVWDQTTEPVFRSIREFELASANGTVARAKPAAAWVIVRLALAGGLGLLAVVASVIISITTARSLIRQLERLREAARQLAHERLPGVVERLGRGEPVDVDAEAPPLTFGPDEIGQVGDAFNAVQRTAIRVAVEQAELRQNVRDVFLNLARRNQALVHRQLSLLDAMERRETQADGLRELFRVDHLATRMRRNAENLIVLSGAAPGRRWRNPVPFVDVVRGALAEVEDYTRVSVLPVEPVALAGRAVGDVIHLLAELVENAASFSPPYTEVQIGARRVANGVAVEIEDRGLGMPAADLAAINAQLAEPPELNLADTARLGIFVVSQLAARHGIKVQLRDSPYGGTTAIVLIPQSLVVEGVLAPIGPAGADDTETLNHARRAIEAPARAPVQRQQEADVPGGPRHLHGEGEQITYTPAGLPARVPQASRTSPRHATPNPAAPLTTREPDQVRRIMASFQLGSARGRTDAAKVAEPPPPEGGATGTDES